MNDNNLMLKSFISSQSGIILNAFLTNFLEVIKNRQISNYIICYKSNCVGSNFKNKKLFNFQSTCDHNKNFVSEFKNSYNSIGMKTFFVGITNIIKSGIIRVGCFLPIYEFFKIKINQTNVNQLLKTFAPIIISRSIVTTVSYYLEFRITIQQSKSEFTKNKINFKAFLPYYFKEVFFSSIFWLIYENFKIYYKNYENNAYNNFLLGSIAGGLSGLITYPFEFKKVYSMLDKNNSILNIIQKNGVNVLSTGFLPRFLKTSIGNGMLISYYEVVFNNLKKY